MTPGTIGVLSLELSRYAIFGYSLSALKRPEGTHILWSMGKKTIDGQNYLVEGMQGDWLWFLDDDHKFGEDALLDLLAHDVDIVCPLNVQRDIPFGPTVWGEKGEHFDHWSYLKGKPGLVEVPATGGAGMLIKRRVFEKIPPPWFEWAPKGSPYHGSDLAFCWKARQAGFKVHIDTSTRFGHTTIATFIPVPLGTDGEFAVAMEVQGKIAAYFRFKEGQQAALFEQVGLRE